ncbi:hypothetical protein [Paraburkholderia susongensis]|uniref:Uncharacterized protein n=1 Tax=Paraburkholderia susongensis TaxID=1515439 RepID=A0A1X7I5G1_9BURK|nr:hypothetical protein [Paraburkholderia susongensis]SMG09685.1 hypothetical protein SAMN06265784_101338 [Paraburkholderia susongensis]
MTPISFAISAEAYALLKAAVRFGRAHVESDKADAACDAELDEGYALDDILIRTSEFWCAEYNASRRAFVEAYQAWATVFKAGGRGADVES